MKKQFVYIGSVIILIISVFTFVVFGVGTEVFSAIFGSKNKIPAFGKYDGKKIEYAAGTKYATIASAIAENYKNQGYEINSQIEYYIFSQAFNQTIMTMAFSDAVSKSKYTVPQTAVDRELIPYFSDANGKYSPKLYNQTDQNTINNMRSEILNSLEYSRYTDDLLGSTKKVNGNSLYGLKVSSKEQDFITSMGKDNRSFNLVAFDKNSFPKTEASIFGKTKAELFMKYDISAITLDEEKQAQSLLKQIKNNEITFDDAVSEKSQKYYSGSDGKLASPYHYQIQNMLNNVEDMPFVTGLEKDVLSNVIQTKRGYTIFRGNGEPVAANFDTDEIQTIVINYLKENESSYIEDYYINIAKNFASEASLKGFKKACDNLNVTMFEVPAFPLNYGDSDFYKTIPSSDIPVLSGASQNENVLKTAFSLKMDEISAPVVLGSNILVMQLTGIQEDNSTPSNSYNDTLNTNEQNSALSSLINSDKVENNFTEVFFSHFMNTEE